MPSDPDSHSAIPLTAPAASAGEPPFYLACAFCRWDSKEVGITFDKPTGLARMSLVLARRATSARVTSARSSPVLTPDRTVQLQKGEDAAPELLEFDHLKDHLEPFLRRSHAHVPHVPTPATAAASASLLKEIPGLQTRYGSLFGLSSRARGDGRAAARDELDAYDALGPACALRGKGKGREDVEEDRVRQMREMDHLEDIAGVEKRWTAAWSQPLLATCVGFPLSLHRRALILFRGEQRAQAAPHAASLQAL